MKATKVYYAQLNNMGDQLNKLIMREVFGLEIVRRTPLTCELSGIGSGLGQFTYSDKKWLACAEKITGRLFPETYIWGTGFIRYGIENPFYRSNMHFCAVRGELSKKNIEKILGKKIDTVLGDGGILSSYILDHKVEKKHAVGIVAHYKEQNHPAFDKIADAFSNSIRISVSRPPKQVIEEIAGCECIISSSLHGLIIADSLRIPNIHVKVSDAMLGDGFKFDDYYSSYGLPHFFIKYSPKFHISLDEIYDSYRITDKMTEKQKKEMYEAFPFKEGID